MPELPEAERARAVVEREALGRRIAAVDDADTWVCRPHAPGEIAAALVGSALTTAERRGKAIRLQTDAGPALGLHLGMAGRVVLVSDGASHRWDRFGLRFEDGATLALRDSRRLGRVVLEPDLEVLGPDAADVGRTRFRAQVGRGRAPIKARIMDQRTIAGVGNLLADEALWRSRLSPLRPAGSLGTDELDVLRREIRAATRNAIRRGGVHTGDLVAHRRPDGRCPRCGTPLMRAAVGGRTTWWCPSCQGEPVDLPPA